MKRRAPWTFYEPGNPAQLVCKRCGTREPVHLPMSVTEFTRRTDAFIRAHSKCLEHPPGGE